MPLGTYSIIRFSNNLNDQRVNLGVVVWHPLDGLRLRLCSSFARVHTIDSRQPARRVKIQLDAIKDEVNSSQGDGRKVLEVLARRFREGVEVSAPYPAKMSGLDDTLDRLYGLLVTPPGPSRRGDSQEEFAEEFREALAGAIGQVQSVGPAFEEMGTRRVNGVYVDLGIRTMVGRKAAFWHSLSLLGRSRPAAQVARAKAVALDIQTIRTSFPEYSEARQFVAVQSPTSERPHYVRESVAWLRHGADDVLLMPKTEPIGDTLKTALHQLGVIPQ